MTPHEVPKKKRTERMSLRRKQRVTQTKVKKRNTTKRRKKQIVAFQIYQAAERKGETEKDVGVS